MANANPTWGSPGIHGELLKPGIKISERTVARLMPKRRNHPFLDGNKRVGTVACLVFLELNGCEFTAPEEELTEIVFALARSELSKADIAIFMRNWTS